MEEDEQRNVLVGRVETKKMENTTVAAAAAVVVVDDDDNNNNNNNEHANFQASAPMYVRSALSWDLTA
jgi:hypothetical protein